MCGLVIQLFHTTMFIKHRSYTKRWRTWERREKGVPLLPRRCGHCGTDLSQAQGSKFGQRQEAVLWICGAGGPNWAPRSKWNLHPQQWSVTRAYLNKVAAHTLSTVVQTCHRNPWHTQPCTIFWTWTVESGRLRGVFQASGL